VGIADADNLDGAPQGHRPKDILQDAKNVIVFGIPTPRAVIGQAYPTIYTRSQFLMHTKLDLIAYEVSLLLEANEINAIPVPARHLHMEAMNGKIMGDLSFKHAAVQAGIGQMGRSTLVIHPKYGARLNLMGVVTDGSLDFDRPFDQDLCGECMRCVEACPVKAVYLEGETINKERCARFYSINPDIYHETHGLMHCRECRRVCPYNG
jgi:epoxyqueuosine reductase QueG